MATTYRLSFEPTGDGPRRFRSYQEGLRIWGQVPENAQKRQKDRRSRPFEAELMIAFRQGERIGPEPTDDDEQDLRFCRLPKDGHTMLLSGGAYALLKERYDEAPFPVEYSDEQEDFLNWLKNKAEEVKDGDNAPLDIPDRDPDAITRSSRPRAVGKAG